MPTENELKYVIRMDSENDVRRMADCTQIIYQGYLVASRGASLRIRKVWNPKKGNTNYFMTFKYTVNGRVIEVETKIDKRDFDDLWSVSMNKLEKVRHKVKASSGEVWEIDFFKDHHDRTYFALAEIEMPEGQLAPIMIPPFLNEIIIHSVPLTDTRFASKLLADVRYAQAMYQTLLEESCVKEAV